MTAWDLKKVWPEVEFHIVPDAGHSAKEVGIFNMLVKVCHFRCHPHAKLIDCRRLRTSSQTSSEVVDCGSTFTFPRGQETPPSPGGD
jgi:hypothetical protein